MDFLFHKIDPVRHPLIRKLIYSVNCGVSNRNFQIKILTKSTGRVRLFKMLWISLEASKTS